MCSLCSCEHLKRGLSYATMSFSSSESLLILSFMLPHRIVKMYLYVSTVHIFLSIYTSTASTGICCISQLFYYLFIITFIFHFPLSNSSCHTWFSPLPILSTNNPVRLFRLKDSGFEHLKCCKVSHTDTHTPQHNKNCSILYTLVHFYMFPH